MRPADRLRLALAGELVDALEQLVDEKLDARDPLVDTEEAARLLETSAAAVRERVYRGSLPGVRVGRRLLIPRSSVMAARKDGYGEGISGAAPLSRPAP